jgi:hypothetical protein
MVAYVDLGPDRSGLRGGLADEQFGKLTIHLAADGIATGGTAVVGSVSGHVRYHGLRSFDTNLDVLMSVNNGVLSGTHEHGTAFVGGHIRGAVTFSDSAGNTGTCEDVAFVFQAFRPS